MWTRKDWLIAAGLTALAALLRLYQLGQVPPGFQFDEAFNAIDAQQVLHGNLPLFLPANGGREVLYTYWQALLGAVLGVNVYSLRLASALAGIATIPATYALLRRLLTRNSRTVAGFTALVLAINLWHIQFSRYGIRVITMPLLLCGVFGAFWLAGHASGRRARIGWSIVAGLLVGLTPWTHPTGRFVPVILLLYVLWLWWRRPALRRWAWDGLPGGLAITGVTAFVIFLPLGMEFVRHPDFFFGHASEVSIFAERVSGSSPLGTLADNLLHVAGMFSVYGDLDWTHNLAGRPVFDWFLAIPFYLGTGLWIWRLRRADDPDFDALSLLGLWALVMLLPTVLSEAAPNYSRTLPALPAAFVGAGLGLTWVTQLTRPVPWAGPALAGTILVASLGSTVYDYFGRFARAEAVYYTYDADKLDALERLGGLTDANRVFVSQLWGERHATVYFLRGQLGIESIDTSDTVVLPPPGLGLVYGFPAEQHERAEQIAALWPDATLTDLLDPYGKHLITLVQVPADAAAAWPADLAPTATTEAHFFDAPTLLGMRADDGRADLLLHWRADAPTFRDLTTFVHLLDQDGARVGQVDKLPANGSFRTPYWLPGDRVVDRYVPDLSDLCAGGETVRVVVGWYQYLADNARMARTDAPGDTALAGTMTLPYQSYALDRFAPEQTIDAPSGDGLVLTGYDLRVDAPKPGAPLTLDLLWRGTPAGADATMRLFLQRGGEQVTLPPGDLVIAPDAAWAAGEALCRRVRTHIPVETPPGRYAVIVATAGGTTALQEIEIATSTRTFDLPTLDHPVDATFDSRLALRGFDQAFDGTTLTLALVWQALVLPTGDANVPHKVFVHVLDEDGQIVAQSDAEPAGGYSTNRWLPGEVVVDTHTIEIPAAGRGQPLQLRIGVYEPVSGARLPVTDASGQPYPADAVPLGEVGTP